MTMANFMTQASYDRLLTEMHFIQEKEIPRLTKAKQAAAEEGDLKENAEYHACKENLNQLQARLENLRVRLAGVSYIDTLKIPCSLVSVGTRVLFQELEKKNTLEYTILGSEDVDIAKNIISIVSPIAKSLIAKKVNDVVELKTPEGSRKVKILSIKHFKDEK
jgi:transcription elongation factor GreA